MADPTPQTGRVTFLEGRGELPMLEIATPWSTAEIYLHGAHVTHFKKHNEPPMLFLSQCSRFLPEAPIRGGIPIIFPWFGKPADKPLQHGLVRTLDWELKEIHSPPDGSVNVRLAAPRLPELADGAIRVEYFVTINSALTVELVIANESVREFAFEDCLHTYFTVGDIEAVSVTGLKGADYLDQLAARARKQESADSIRVAEEVDRIYVDTTQAVEIRDESLRRIIRIEKSGSASTVVWNPWIAKSKAMEDFGDEEYKEMICVESGNVVANQIKLPPGKSSRLKVKLSGAPL